MSDFQGMDDLLSDFLTEATELLSDVDNKLVELEKRPHDHALLNEVFRGFHTIKGGAGFLAATELVGLCHITENLFDMLRNGERTLSPELMDRIMWATAAVRDMFGELAQKVQPKAADALLLEALRAAVSGESKPAAVVAAPTAAAPAKAAAQAKTATQATVAMHGEPDWQKLYNALLELNPPVALPSAAGPVVAVPAEQSFGRRSTDQPGQAAPHPGRRETDRGGARETSIRVDTDRLDKVLNLSGEIGLTKNRLTCLRADIQNGKTNPQTLQALDLAISQLDLLVGDLQSSVMKTRMQPIGRLFQKYPRLARDLSRSLGKDIELEITGEETELDKTMIEELNDPLVHLVRNAVDHGIEDAAERKAAGKPAQSVVKLSAQQAGDHIVIEISDDGRGMRPDVLRAKAVEKGLIDADAANALDDSQALHLIFMPGFSTKEQVTSVSGRGVGMDVVKTNIHKLNGRIMVTSVPGAGTTISISLPLTLAILPVLVVKLAEQSFAVPLGTVREILNIDPQAVQSVSGRATLVVRNEVLPVYMLSSLLGWPQQCAPSYGVLMQCGAANLVLAVDGFVGRDDVVIKPLENVRPKGVAGATLSGDGSVVLVLDMEELLVGMAGSGVDELVNRITAGLAPPATPLSLPADVANKTAANELLATAA
jgi:two-component system, chemotaxis family, sensor kinase CheA